MELDFSKEEELFRDEVRTWLAENKPKEARPKDPFEAKEYDKAWQRKQYDGGWAGINWPKEFGGRELGVWQQMIWHEEFTRAGCTQGYMVVALNHGGLTVAASGSDAQKAEHLPKILKGEKVWVQGFSEPGAGSDLAGIKTRGVIDGDDLVINGQKIWTSFAYLGDWQILLIRTDPDAERHRGLTLVLNWMDNEGMEIRRIPQMDGEADLCEVFYTDVRVPLKNVAGEINEGWKAAMGTLGVEHGALFMPMILQFGDTLDDLVTLAKETVGPDGKRYAIHDDQIARRIAMARATLRGLRSMLYMDLSRAARDPVRGGLNFYRLGYSELSKEVMSIASDILGPRVLSRTGPNAPWPMRVLTSAAAGIGGGTSEMQRNNIGWRLGLPK